MNSTPRKRFIFSLRFKLLLQVISIILKNKANKWPKNKTQNKPKLFRNESFYFSKPNSRFFLSLDFTFLSLTKYTPAPPTHTTNKKLFLREIKRKGNSQNEKSWISLSINGQRCFYITQWISCFDSIFLKKPYTSVVTSEFIWGSEQPFKPVTETNISNCEKLKVVLGLKI